MTLETIERTVQSWSQEPEKAKGRPTVRARSDGARAVLEAGSFCWEADLPPSLGGTNQAPSPTALFLSALAGCAVVFLKDTLAPQLGVRVDAVQATVSCATDSRGLLGIDDAAPDLQDISLDIQIESPDGEAAVRRLLAVWRERCPIYLGLTKPLEVRLSSRVIDWYAGN